MKKGSIIVFFMVLISGFCGFTVQGNAQQIDKEIANNQVEQVKLELEIVNNEILDFDSANENEYLESQAQAQKDAALAQQQLDVEIESLLEQVNQDSEQLGETFSKEAQENTRQIKQETVQQVEEIEVQAQKVESDKLDQE
ncbi:MAG: hypothetical protein KKD05_00585 [Candidatus Omnitrophica bacterium]|nr:hypothetical protein [Candidatus Omnitrophota bacterium]